MSNHSRIYNVLCQFAMIHDVHLKFETLDCFSLGGTGQNEPKLFPYNVSDELLSLLFCMTPTSCYVIPKYLIQVISEKDFLHLCPKNAN